MKPEKFVKLLKPRNIQIPKKLYYDKIYLNDIVFKHKQYKIDKKNFDDSRIIYGDILDYNELGDINENLNYFPNQRLVENAFNWEENFYEEIEKKIKNINQKFNKEDFNASTISGASSYATFDKLSSYIFSEKGNIDDQDFTVDRITDKHANMKIRISKDEKELTHHSSDSEHSFSSLIEKSKREEHIDKENAENQIINDGNVNNLYNKVFHKIVYKQKEHKMDNLMHNS